MKKTFPRLSLLGQTTIIFILLALFFGVIIAKEVPAFWGYDESAHFSRAYQVSEGALLPQQLPNKNYGGQVPVSLVELNAAASRDLARVAQKPVLDRQDFQHQALQESIKKQPIDEHQKANFDFPGSAAYSPLAYAAPATGILVCRLADCSLGTTVFIARIFGLFAYVAIVAGALWLLRAKKIKWLVFVVGILPMTLFQAAAVSADGPVIALSLLLFAILVKAFSDKKLSRRLIIVLAAIAICLPLIKANYGLLSLGIIPAALVICKDRRKALTYVGVGLLATAIITLGWLAAAHGPSKAISTLHASNTAPNAVISLKQQSLFILEKPVAFGQTLIKTGTLNEAYWAYTTVGEFALNAVQLSLSAVVLAYLALVGAAFYASSELLRYKKQAMSLGLIALLTAGSIFGALYLTFTPVGSTVIDGVQGRYFIPLIPFLLAAIAAIVPVRVMMSPKTATILFSASSSLLLLVSVIYYGLATY